MDFIATKELAEKWQISESRIVRLAKNGRIPGAQLIGKSWVFPPDVQKPADHRRKEIRIGSPDIFRFPLYLYSNYSEDEIRRDFTQDERVLYEGEQLFFAGAYRRCRDLLNVLAESTADRYVRFGALYHLSLISVYLHRYGSAFHYYDEIHGLFLTETAHKTEIGYLIRNLESYFVGNNSYIEDFSIDMQAPYPLHMREYLLLECAYSDMLRAQYKSIPVSPLPYEILLQNDAGRFSPLSSLTMHLYVAALCRSYGQTERSVYHIREACRIAGAHDLEYSSVAFMSKYMINTYESALLEQDPAQLKRLKGISDEMFEAFHRLFDFIGKDSLLHILSPADSILISCAIKEMTNKEIADLLRLSMNTISKRFSILFEKVGVHSKKELVDWYLRTIREY